MSRKVSLGWAIIHPQAEVPGRTGGWKQSAKLYVSEGAAKGARTQRFPKDWLVVEVFTELPDDRN